MAVKREAVDLILLDINLPDTDGFRLKEQLGEIPVIFVTAREEICDRVRGLESGAEDYIVKPFHIQELAARVQRVLKRYQREDSFLAIGEVQVFLRERTVMRKGIPVELTNREFELLECLIHNKNIALSRDKLLELVWGVDYEGELKTVDVHISRLRKKLGLEVEIKTVYKYGYRLEMKE